MLFTSGLALLAMVVAMPEEAKAAYPGYNGRIAYTEDTCGEGCSDLFTKMPDDSTSVSLSVDGYDPAYTYGGDRIVYSGYNEVYAIPASGGAPEQLTHNGNAPMSFFNPTLSPDGQTLLYYGFNTDTREGAIYTVLVSGGVPKLIAGGDGGNYGAPEWSPDGTRISYYYYDGTVGSQGTIRTVTTAGGTPTTLVNDACADQHSWSGDGERVAYISCERGFHVLKTAPSAGGPAQTVYEDPTYIRSPAYSPDGRSIAFVAPDPNDPNRFEEGFMVPSSGGTPQQITHTRYGSIGLDWGASPSDTTAPRVISTVPASGAKNVARSADISAAFSEDMMSSSINGTTFKLFKKGRTINVAAAVSYNTVTGKATLNPTNPLKRGATYKAIVTTEAKDLAGDRLDQNSGLSGLQPKRWSFTVKE